jgi:hypothetical protein
MRRLILLLISSFAVLFVSAQEEIFSDSIPKKQPEIKVRQPIMDRPLNFDQTISPEEINLIDNSIQKPGFQKVFEPVKRNQLFLLF